MKSYPKNNKNVKMSPDYITHFKLTYNVTNHGLAATLGVAKETVQLWEEGKRLIPETTARLLVLFFREPELMEEFRTISGSYSGARLT